MGRTKQGVLLPRLHLPHMNKGAAPLLPLQVLFCEQQLDCQLSLEDPSPGMPWGRAKFQVGWWLAGWLAVGGRLLQLLLACMQALGGKRCLPARRPPLSLLAQLPLHPPPARPTCFIVGSPAPCQVTAYYAPQFAELRRRCMAGGERAFLASISRCRKWASRGGKSAVYFARSLDKRWVRGAGCGAGQGKWWSRAQSRAHTWRACHTACCSACAGWFGPAHLAPRPLPACPHASPLAQQLHHQPSSCPQRSATRPLEPLQTPPSLPPPPRPAATSSSSCRAASASPSWSLRQTTFATWPRCCTGGRTRAWPRYWGCSRWGPCSCSKVQGVHVLKLLGRPPPPGRTAGGAKMLGGLPGGGRACEGASGARVRRSLVGALLRR